MDKQKKQDIIIRICCVVAALALWMYIRSSEDPVVTSVIKYVPVQILNEETLKEKKLVLIPDQEYYVNLTVKAPASIIRDLDKNKDFNLVADLEGYAFTSGENNIQVKVKEISAGVSIVNAEALSMKVDVDVLAEKDVEVVPDVVGEVAEGYYADKPVISPNSVSVFGPESYIKKVSNAVVQVDISSASGDISKTGKLTLVDSNGKEVIGLSLSSEYVQVNTVVKKGKYLEVDVQTKGTSPSGVKIESIEAIPTSIEVVGGSDIVDEIKSIKTQEIDLSSITENTTKNINLIIPSGIQTVKDEITVQVKFTVKNISEQTFSIPITYANLGTKLTLENNPATLELTVSGEASEVSKLTVDSFKATVDLKDLTAGPHEIAVQLSGVPTSIQVKTQTPEKITVTIKDAITGETGNNGD